MICRGRSLLHSCFRVRAGPAEHRGRRGRAVARGSALARPVRYCCGRPGPDALLAVPGATRGGCRRAGPALSVGLCIRSAHSRFRLGRCCRRWSRRCGRTGAARYRHQPAHAARTGVDSGGSRWSLVSRIDASSSRIRPRTSAMGRSRAAHNTWPFLNQPCVSSCISFFCDLHLAHPGPFFSWVWFSVYFVLLRLALRSPVLPRGVCLTRGWGARVLAGIVCSRDREDRHRIAQALLRLGIGPSIHKRPRARHQRGRAGRRGV
jgi:hypothetical protein